MVLGKIVREQQLILRDCIVSNFDLDFGSTCALLAHRQRRLHQRHGQRHVRLYASDEHSQDNHAAKNATEHTINE